MAGRAARGLARIAIVSLLARGAQAQDPSAARRPSAGPGVAPGAAPAWIVAAPDAALAWFAVLADLRLPGDGAFAFTRPTPGAQRPDPDRARALASLRGHEVLHFVPLYHPSADRAALAAALRAAADSAAPQVSPRASLLVGALTQSLPARDRRAQLPALASALEARRVEAPAPERLAAWQRALDSLYLPALAPWLALERLDRGRLLVVPAIGGEGRLFAGTQDRADNLVAVGTFDGDADALAPLHAFVREACFPAVTRATRDAGGFAVGDPAAALRASLAAVRCGAALMDARLPARADAYRAFWVRQSAEGAGAAPGRASFDRVFPPDAALAGGIERAIARLRADR